MKQQPALALFVGLLAMAWVPFAADARGDSAVAAESLPAPSPADAPRRTGTAEGVGCEAAFRLGEDAEENGAFAGALARYRTAVATGSAPGTGALARDCARRASARVEWLGARSEGSFAPLERLERVRRDPDLANDPSTVASLAKEADRMPPGIVRVEARMLVAEAWLGRMDRPDAALAELRKVVDDPGADALTARLAQRELVSALVRAGRMDAADAEAHAHASWLDARFVGQIERLVRRRALRRACLVVLASFAIMAATALVRARRRGTLADAWRSLRSFAPVAALFVAFVGGGGGLLASHYESGNALPFLLFGAGALPLLIAARMWGAVGRADKTARAARAILCAATVLATAFVLLDAVNPTYLEGFGL